MEGLMTEKLKACEDCGCRVYDQSAHDRICETEKLRQRLTASEQRIAELEAERDGLNVARFRDELEACIFANEWLHKEVIPPYMHLKPFCHIQEERTETDCCVVSFFVKDVLTAQYVTVRDASNFTLLTRQHWQPRTSSNGGGGGEG
jgi:hypothetical protein